MAYKVAKGKKLRHNGMNYIAGDPVPAISDADAEILVVAGKLTKTGGPVRRAAAQKDE